MAMTISFGESTGSTMANWAFILLVISIFLFFTGLWKTIANKWAGFFGSGLWTQTIANAKATWQSVPPAQTAYVQSLPTTVPPLASMMPEGSTPAVVPVVATSGISAPSSTSPPVAGGASPVNPSPLKTA